ncbi:Holliday junction resolvase RuvX [Catenovulum sp. SM1970]|uniref:Holliday junction resolvase RuvX n=1 Tax=Marinifaba aquimaris TaxID=2741323 RepID=UPI001573A7CC|nr:Holliday junction resolvase RuvX [Marinifaba aquimaris]NTS77835.1 Holliday junction resolvase RuvX [Marinifaba aquimaris]
MTQPGQRLIMAFDFGAKSIGIATGNEVTASANALCAIKANDGIPNWDELGQILKEWQPQLLVVGLPLNMDGTEQELTLRARKFANRLHGRYGLQVETYDERLTTVDAKAQLFEQGGYRNLQKGKVDALSAEIILNSWFESQF